MKPPVAHEYIFGKRRPVLVVAQRAGRIIDRLINSNTVKANQQEGEKRQARQAAAQSVNEFISLVGEQAAQKQGSLYFRTRLEHLNVELTAEHYRGIERAGSDFRHGEWYLMINNGMNHTVSNFSIQLKASDQLDVSVIDNVSNRYSAENEDFSAKESTELYRTVGTAFSLLSEAYELSNLKTS